LEDGLDSGDELHCEEFLPQVIVTLEDESLESVRVERVVGACYFQFPLCQVTVLFSKGIFHSLKINRLMLCGRVGWKVRRCLCRVIINHVIVRHLPCISVLGSFLVTSLALDTLSLRTYAHPGHIFPSFSKSSWFSCFLLLLPQLTLRSLGSFEVFWVQLDESGLSSSNRFHFIISRHVGLILTSERDHTCVTKGILLAFFLKELFLDLD